MPHHQSLYVIAVGSVLTGSHDQRGLTGLRETKHVVSTMARRGLLPMNSWVCRRMQNAVERCIVTVFVATASRSRGSCRSTTMTTSLEEICLPDQRTPKPWLSRSQTCLHLIFLSSPLSGSLWQCIPASFAHSLSSGPLQRRLSSRLPPCREPNDSHARIRNGRQDGRSARRLN